MKTLMIVILTVSMSMLSKAQNQKFAVPISKLTEVMIAKNYSTEEQKELINYPQKIKSLDYLYSKSFQIQNSTYTEEQLLKVDINKYNLARKVDENVLVFDEAYGLQLILLSLNKVEAEKEAILYPNTKRNSSTNKIAN